MSVGGGYEFCKSNGPLHFPFLSRREKRGPAGSHKTTCRGPVITMGLALTEWPPATAAPGHSWLSEGGCVSWLQRGRLE